MNIIKKLLSLGVELTNKDNSSDLESLPQCIRNIVAIYKNSIFFKNNVYSDCGDNVLFVSGKFSVDLLWGLEQGENNIELQNQRLSNINQTKLNLFSFAGTIEGDHICISPLNSHIYYFDHESLAIDIFDNIELFFESLFIEDEDEDEDEDEGLISYQLDF